MTDQEVHAQYQVVFSGAQYLCIPPVQVPKPAPDRPVPITDWRQPSTVRQRVLDALPGTVPEIVQKSQACMTSVRAAVWGLWQQGLVRKQRVGTRVVYAQVPAGEVR